MDSTTVSLCNMSSTENNMDLFSMEDADDQDDANDEENDHNYMHIPVSRSVQYPASVVFDNEIFWERKRPASLQQDSDEMEISKPPLPTRTTIIVTTVTTKRKMNMISILPDDVLTHMATFLNIGSLKQARVVNRKFNRILSRDEAGWEQHCQRLWNHRLHVSAAMRRELSLMPAKDAYRFSCADARLRHSVRTEELMFDPTQPHASTTVWSFRFKDVAGVEWTNTDPWHAGGEARRFVFLTNGSVRQLVYRNEYNNNNNNKTSQEYTLHQPFFDAPNLRGGLTITWRFVSQPIDLPKKDIGAYLRLTVAGRDTPVYMVHRSPLGNWGFVMENCWGVFASFLLPRKVTPDTVQREPRMRLRRTRTGVAQWHDVSQDESDDDEEATSRDRSKNILMEDDSLAVTCRWQWREALLYNLGASTFPDGPNANAAFDRAWRLSMRSMQSFGFPTAAQVNPPPENPTL